VLDHFDVEPLPYVPAVPAADGGTGTRRRSSVVALTLAAAEAAAEAAAGAAAGAAVEAAEAAVEVEAEEQQDLNPSIGGTGGTVVSFFWTFVVGYDK